MPLSVTVNHREFAAQADRLRRLTTHVPVFADDYKVLLAEMIALQAFYFFESAIEAIGAKLVCGARYADGARPAITHPSASLSDALNNMRTVGRTRHLGLLKWNKAAEITENLRYVLGTTENICVVCRNHGARINEVRIVRNHIAHNNSGTRRKFQTIVQRRLGAVPRRLPRPGAFLLREPAPGTTILTEYIVTLGVIVKDVAKC